MRRGLCVNHSGWDGAPALVPVVLGFIAWLLYLPPACLWSWWDGDQNSGGEGASRSGSVLGKGVGNGIDRRFENYLVGQSMGEEEGVESREWGVD